MSNNRFDLVILSHSAEVPVEELVQNLLKLLNKSGDSHLEYKLSEALLFEQNSNAVLEGISVSQGQAYQKQFLELKVKTELRPSLQLVDKETTNSNALFTCPACEHQQEKAPDNAMNTCQRCGVIGEKYTLQQKKEDIYQSEKQRLEQQQQKDLREARERARQTEEEKLREEARQRLGINKKSQLMNTLVSATVVVIMGVAIYFITDTIRQSGASSATTEANQSPTAPDGQISTLQTGADTAGALTGKVPTDTQNALITLEGEQGAAQGSGGPKGSSTNDDNVDAATPPATLLTANLSTETENLLRRISNRTETPRSLITGNRSLSFGQSDLLEQTSEEEAAELKAMLLTSVAEPEPFFQDSNAQQFNEHKRSVQRLLSMNKSDLALVFIEELSDSYAASWLVLDVASYENKRNPENIQDSPLLTMKSLVANSKDSLQEPLLQANLSQIFAMANDPVAAEALRGESLKTLEVMTIHPVDKLYMLRLMEATARQFGNRTSSMYYTRALAAFIEQLPQDQPLLAGRAYTTLASIALSQQQHDIALSWAQKVPSELANQTLMSELTTRREKALAKMQNSFQLDPAPASD